MHNKKSKDIINTSGAFTLVEVMVVIVIIGMSLSVGIITYTENIRQTQLTQGVSRFVDEVSKVRQMTVSRNLVGVTSCTLTHYMIEVEESSLRVFQRCDGSPNDTEIYQTSLPYIQVVQPTDITFSRPYGQLDPQSSVQLRFFHTQRTSSCLSVIVDMMGTVEVDENIISCS